MNRKYMGKYSNVMLTIMREYSEKTSLIASKVINTDHLLFQMEEYLKNNPSETDLNIILSEIQKEQWRDKMEHIGRLGYINYRLLHDFCPFIMRKIYRTDSEAYYVITLKKSGEKKLIEKALLLKQILSGLSNTEETLECKGHCISIVGRNYIYSYQIEAYKRANQTICFDEEGVHVELLYRMGVESSVSYLRSNCRRHLLQKGYVIYGYPYSLVKERLDRVTENMTKQRLMELFPNPADRFVYLIKNEVQHFD